MLHRDIMHSLLAGVPRSGTVVRAKKKNGLRVVLAILPENTSGNGSHLKLTEIVAKMGLVAKVAVQAYILQHAAEQE